MRLAERVAELEVEMQQRITDLERRYAETAGAGKLMGRIEELAAQNLKADASDPCAQWDGIVSEKMLRDGSDRPAAVDRLLATASGSDAWLKCQAWDAERPKVIEQNGRRIKSGNWLNRGDGTCRRIPRSP
jgi:hypothetical protein